MINRSRIRITILASAIAVCSLDLARADPFLTSPFPAPVVSTQTWKDLRDDGVVKQDLDDSCGAASLATILSSFYRVEVSEQDSVEHLVESGVTGSSSFLDLANVAEHYDMHSAGYALSFDKMKELKIPAIVHLEYRENEEHFSVVRGIGDHTVWLGDPLWGNRHFSKQQFLSMWEGPSLTGYLLLIIPKEIDEETVDRDFFKQPAVSRLPLQLLTIGRHLTDIAVSSRH